MKALIVFGTRKGWTQKSAKIIEAELNTKLDVTATTIDLKTARAKGLDLTRYDLIIVGSSIMAGFWKPGVKRFIKKNKNKFTNLAIYVSAGATLQDACKGRISKNEAVKRAIRKYVDPVKHKFQLTTIMDGAFGGEYDNNGKTIFNSWNSNDVRTWAEKLHRTMLRS